MTERGAICRVCGTTAKSSFTCRSCGMRERLGKPVSADANAQITMHPLTFAQLRTFAEEFDALSGDARYAAVSFLDWVEPSVVGSMRHAAVREATSLRVERVGGTSLPDTAYR